MNKRMGSLEEGRSVSTELHCGISVGTMLRAGMWKRGFCELFEEA